MQCERTIPSTAGIIFMAHTTQVMLDDLSGLQIFENECTIYIFARELIHQSLPDKLPLLLKTQKKGVKFAFRQRFRSLTCYRPPVCWDSVQALRDWAGGLSFCCWCEKGWMNKCLLVKETISSAFSALADREHEPPCSGKAAQSLIYLPVDVRGKLNPIISQLRDVGSDL